MMSSEGERLSDDDEEDGGGGDGNDGGSVAANGSPATGGVRAFMTVGEQPQPTGGVWCVYGGLLRVWRRAFYLWVLECVAWWRGPAAAAIAHRQDMG